jgi:predicted phage terminase large subunit-like protein
LLASYGDVPARRMGRRTRSVLMQSGYQRLFDTSLSQDSRAAEQFTLTNGSEYFATSIMGSVTSYRADGLIIDDPVKGHEAASSQDQRDKTWDAYQNDLRTRLVPGGWIVDIQTRWHENDLAGRLLPSDWRGQSGVFRCTDGFDWEVLCIQARCELPGDLLGRAVGEYLMGTGFDEKHWSQFECQPQTWASLYQQRPAPLEGALFKPDKIQVLDAEPSGVSWVRGWDLAASKDQGDWTAGAKMGKWNDRIVIADVARLQGSPDEVERTLVGTATQDGLTCVIHIPQDPGQAGKSQVQYLTSKLVGHRVVSSPETGDKVTRASPLAAQVNVGNVYMVRGTWNRAFTEELRVFPNGTNDDQVDASSRAFAAITSARRSYFG